MERGEYDGRYEVVRTDGSGTHQVIQKRIDGTVRLIAECFRVEDADRIAAALKLADDTDANARRIQEEIDRQTLPTEQPMGEPIREAMARAEESAVRRWSIEDSDNASIASRVLRELGNGVERKYPDLARSAAALNGDPNDQRYTMANLQKEAAARLHEARQPRPALAAVPCRSCRNIDDEAQRCTLWQLEGPDVHDEGRMPRDLALQAAAGPQMLRALEEAWDTFRRMPGLSLEGHGHVMIREAIEAARGKGQHIDVQR